MSAGPPPTDAPGGGATRFPLDDRLTLIGTTGVELGVHATELTVAVDDTGELAACELRFRVDAGRLAAAGLLDRTTDVAPPSVVAGGDVEVTARLRDGATTTSNAATLRRELQRGGALTGLDQWDVVAVRSSGGRSWS